MAQRSGKSEKADAVKIGGDHGRRPRDSDSAVHQDCSSRYALLDGDEDGIEPGDADRSSVPMWVDA
jgi:hypothetical protein